MVPVDADRSTVPLHRTGVQASSQPQSSSAQSVRPSESSSVPLPQISMGSVRAV